VIIGTVMQGFWEEYPGLDKRLEQLGAMVDRMAEESKRKYGRGLDLAILPEEAVTGESSDDVVRTSATFEGPVRDACWRISKGGYAPTRQSSWAGRAR
jgi:hypothetical protein